MKYIRTKDKIYEEEKVRLEKEDIEKLILNRETIKQADTIEELCDEIIIERYKEPYHSNSPIGKSKSWKAYQPLVKDVKGIYGAIWTDRGLIYVAKMNEKGELELL